MNSSADQIGTVIFIRASHDFRKGVSNRNHIGLGQFDMCGAYHFNIQKVDIIASVALRKRGTATLLQQFFWGLVGFIGFCFCSYNRFT